MHRGGHTQTMQGGLIKPITQRGRTTASRRVRNPAVNTNATGGGGGIICGSRNDSLFISSYHEDKKAKYRKQMKERVKKWVVFGALTLFFYAVIRMSRSSEGAPKEVPTSLRSGVAQPNNAIAETKSVPPPPKAVPKPPPAAPAIKVNQFCSYTGGPGWPAPPQKFTLETKGFDDHVCGRKIPVNLGDTTNWPTPETKTLAEPDSTKKEVVLLKKDSVYGNLGAQLNSLFHAYDVAFDTKRPLFMTKDSWVVETLLTLFFGPSPLIERNEEFWNAFQGALGVFVVENEAALPYSVPDYKNPLSLFYTGVKTFSSKQIRDHRSSVLRTLFRYPAALGTENVCSTVKKVVGDQTDKKYTVIHLADPATKGYMSKLAGNTGKDHTAAVNMQPDYVKNILKRLDMLNNEMYAVHGSPKSPDSEAYLRLQKDPELTKQFKDVPFEYSGCLGGNLYLAVLADVYLGNPVDQ